MARLQEPRSFYAPPPPVIPNAPIPVMGPRDPENPYMPIAYAPPAPPIVIPPRSVPVQPLVPFSEAGVAPEFIRGTTQIGSGPQARAFARPAGQDYGAFPPELTTPEENPDVPLDLTSQLNHYYPYDNAEPPYVPPNPPTNLFRPDVRIDGPLGRGSIDDRRAQAPAGRMLLDREQRARRPGPQPSFLRDAPGPVVADVVNGQTIIRDPDNPAYQGYVPPQSPRGAAPEAVPLSSVYGPVARAYQHGGRQDVNIGDVDVENPYIANPVPGLARGAFSSDADYQEYVRTGDWRNADPQVVARARAGGSVDTGGGFDVRGAVLGNNPFGRVIGDVPDKIIRAVASGQSALDLITVHADAIIPDVFAKAKAGDINARGSQGTLKSRYDAYVAQGMAPDQAANKTMEDYGNALQQLAEDPNAPGAARVGAQGARILGLVQSITAPAPVPGSTSIPFAAGILSRGGKKLGEEAATAAAKAAGKAAPEGSRLAEMLAKGTDFSKVPADIRAASEAANPSVIGRERAAIAEAARRVRGEATALTARESTGALGGATTNAEVRSAEQRLIELNRERALQGKGPIDELPAVTHGAGGNDPTRGFQIEKFPGEVQPFMAEVAKQLDPMLAGATAKLTHEDIQVASQLTGKTIAETAKGLAKRGTSSVDIQAVRIGVAAKAKIAQDLATKVATGASRDPKDMYDALSALQEAATIQATLHEAASEAGRTLGVLRTQIDPILASNGTTLAYMAAISRIARSPEHAAAIMESLMKLGDDPEGIYRMLRRLNKPTVGDQLLSVWNLPRALKASLDLSAAGRQGAILSVAHPGMAKEAFRAQLRAFASEDVANAIDRSIRTSPMQPLREKAGLYLSETGPLARLSQREEAFLTNLADRIPGVAGSGRAYVTYLNKLRADRFDEAILSWQKAGIDVTDARAKLLGEWINIASGRGSFPRWAEGAMPLLNGVFFSPRFAVSRFQALGFVPYAMAKRDPEVAKLAAKDLSSFVGANLALMGMAVKAGADVETDMRSPEFGKLRVGDTVIDLWGGEQQIVRNVAQLWAGEKKVVTGANRGDIVPVARDEVAGRFIESKLAPSAGTIWDLGKQVSKADRTAAEGAAPWDQPIGVDFVGQSFSAKDLATSTGQGLFIPMTFGDIIDAVAADRAEGGSGIRGAALGSLSALGVGVSTYSTDEAHGTSPKAPSAPRAYPSRR